MRLIFDSDGGAGRVLDESELVDLYRFRLPVDRPFVRSNFVMSLDGSVQGPDGRSGSINTESDHHLFALQRALADAIVVGAGTVRGEGYRAVDLAPWQRDLRRQEALAPYPTLVIISDSADLDPLIATPEEGPGGPVMIVTPTGKPREQLQPLRSAGVEVIEVDASSLDLGSVIDQLAGSGLAQLLCEGGPGLHRALLAAGLVDEMAITLAPVVVGGAGARSTSGDALDPTPVFALRFALHADDGTLFTSYTRTPEPAAPRLE
jgi:riboflavin-specific deaminase-like protein